MANKFRTSALYTVPSAPDAVEVDLGSFDYDLASSTSLALAAAKRELAKIRKGDPNAVFEGLFLYNSGVVKDHRLVYTHRR